MASLQRKAPQKTPLDEFWTPSLPLRSFSCGPIRFFDGFAFASLRRQRMESRLQSFELLFPQEYLRAALMVSLLSVWVLVGLFYYLNRFTKREYFTVWTAAWLFYALWLT